VTDDTTPPASASPRIEDQTIAVLGGTGPQGRGLARRFATAGLTVVLGSRTAERAEATAAELSSALGIPVSGASNADAAAAADVVLVVVPWDGHRELLESLRETLAGKVVVDCVNPLGFDKQGPYALQVEEGSATQQAAAILTESRVVGAFHNVSAVLLEDPAVERVETDVLVLGDDREATTLVQELADVVPGMRGVYGGRLRNAHQVEALTANLIAINRRYKCHAGLRVTDV
jgi:NADPH-dependent F420 reductase